MIWLADPDALALLLRTVLARPDKPQGSDLAHRPATREAAVLVPLILRPEGVTILLTQRASHLPAHPGQISFPGGAVEDGDANPAATALRETEEETGLAPSRVAVLGELGEYRTSSGFKVIPVVGLIEPGFELRPDPQEVEAAFEIPAAILLDPARYERRWVVRSDIRIKSHFLQYENRLVWGATAGMLIGFARLLGVPGDPVERDDLVHYP